MTLLLASTFAVVPFLAGIALLTWVLMKRSYKRLGRSRRNRVIPHIERVPRPRTAWDGVQRDTLAQVERQKVEMHEMTRDLNGQLSSKIIILEQLISDSQQQIDRLEQLLEKAEHTSSADRSKFGR